jgi:type I restriction enzyme M protein
LVRGVVFSKEDEVSEGGVQVLRATNINKDRYELDLDEVKHVSPKADFSDEKKLRRDDIFICLASGSKDHIGKVALIKEDTDFYFGGFMGAIRVKPGRLHPGYLLKQLTTGHFNDFLREQIAGANINNLSGGLLYRFKIPLPPLEVQKEIVAEIEGYQKVIDGARAVLDHYRPHIPIHPDWPMAELAELCAIKSGGTPDRSNESFWNGDIPWVTTTLIDYGVIDAANEFITAEGLKNSSAWIVPKGTVLMAMYGQGVTRGRVAILGIDAAINQACAAFQLKGDSLDPGYLFRVLQSRYEDLRKISDARGGNQSNLSAQVLKEYSISLPPLATQQAIVAEIEAEQALVAANRELIARFEKKIQATLARVWGEDVQFSGSCRKESGNAGEMSR